MEKKVQSAWRIGSLCIATYLASYVTKNTIIGVKEAERGAHFIRQGLMSLYATQMNWKNLKVKKCLQNNA